MRKILKSIVLVAALISPTTAWADIRFGVAAEPYPPFTSKDASGKWVGWEVDFMNALCAKLSEKCTIVEVAWDGMIPALDAKKFDVVLASMSITDKRKAVIDFSSTYYNSSAQLLGAAGAASYKSPADLNGKRVGVQSASIYQAYAQKYFTPAGIEIKTYGKEDDALADLAAGRIDYVLGEALALDAMLNSPVGSCCKVAGTVTPDASIFGIGVGLGLRKGDGDLQQRLNGAIKSIVTSGELAAITQRNHLTGKIVLPDAQ